MAGDTAEGFWLRADRQTAGRGRQGRAWQSPIGNFHGSTIVRLRPEDPSAATLGFVAAVALIEQVVRLIGAHPGVRPAVALKWPNDVMIDGRKLSGLLLERSGDVVVVGVGVNLAYAPTLPDRPTTALIDHGVGVDPMAFAPLLAEGFATWLARWRGEGFATVRARWFDFAYPDGTAMSVNLPDGERLTGTIAGLGPDGALILALATGERRTIHAGDVFLV